MTFKQPGFSLHAGTSPAKADLLKRKNYKKVDVSGGNKTKSTREEYEAMKKAPGKPTDKLTTEYGGKWSKKGNATTYTNEEGLKPVQVASRKSRKKADQKKKYIEENTTSPTKAASPVKKYKPAPPRKKKTVDKKRAGLFKRGEEKTTNYRYDEGGNLTSSSSKTRETRSLAGRVFKKGKYTGSGSRGKTTYKDGRAVTGSSSTYRTRK